jgi:hypothetical protein
MCRKDLLRVGCRATFPALVLYELVLLLLVGLLVLLHQAAQEVLVITGTLWDLGCAGGGRVELLGVSSSVAGSSCNFREVATDTGSARGPNFDCMGSLLRLTGVGHTGRGMLDRGLMGRLGLLGCLNNIKVMLIGPRGSRILRRMQNLLLPLQLLLEHDLGLLLIASCGCTILQRLRVSSCTPVATVSLVDSSRPTSIILRGLISNNLLLELQDIT